MRIATVALPLVTLLATVGACAVRGDQSAPASSAPPASVAITSPRAKHGEGAMREVRATTMAAALTRAGLDPKHLPPIEKLDKAQKLRVMKTFTESLGVACFDCHAEGDFVADTRRKRVAKRMFNEIVRLTAFENGDPVYCDSCHQGSLFVLDRKDKSKVSDFMSDVYVAKLKRTDDREHECSTCHGDPPEFRFITAWKSAPAPDIELAPLAPPIVTPLPATPVPPVPTPAPATPAPAPAPAPKHVSHAASKDCGDKDNLCPLQAWMRKNVASAVAGNDTAALAKALDRVAGMAPDPAWGSWIEMSKTAAEAARKGDMTEARKSCQGCHNAYKTRWRETYRARAVK